MGTFKKIMRQAKVAHKKAQKRQATPNRSDTEIDVRSTGEVPPHKIGSPVELTLKTGSQIELEVNVRSNYDKLESALLGKPRDDEDITRNVKVWMFRDGHPSEPDRVSLELKNGEYLGAIERVNAHFASTMISQIEDAIGTNDSSVSGRPARCLVTMRVEGGWYEEEEDDESTVWEASIYEANVRLAYPIEITEFRDPLSESKPQIAADQPPPNLNDPSLVPGWFNDPLTRHQYRYFDGARWTEHVSDNGIQAIDRFDE